MAYLFTAGFTVNSATETEPLFAGVGFVDLLSGAFQSNCVDLGGVQDWCQTNLGVRPSLSDMNFVRYIGGMGAVWHFSGRWFIVPVGRKPSSSDTAAFTVINPDVAFEVATLLGVDETGVYAPGDASGFSSSFRHLGMDGVEVVTGMGTPFTRGSLGTPLLWRQGDKYRAFGQLGTAFSSSQRGATVELSDGVPGSGLDGTRSQTGVGTNRGVEFSGFFYGYDVIPCMDTATLVQGVIAAENQSASGCNVKAVGQSFSTGAQRVYLQDTVLTASGSGFVSGGATIGAVFEYESLLRLQYDSDAQYAQAVGFGGVTVQGHVGVMPPWEPDGAGVPVQFWTDVVQAYETV